MGKDLHKVYKTVVKDISQYLPPLGDGSDHDHISTEMLEDIRDGIQSHPNVNMRY